MNYEEAKNYKSDSGYLEIIAKYLAFIMVFAYIGMIAACFLIVAFIVFLFSLFM